MLVPINFRVLYCDRVCRVLVGFCSQGLGLGLMINYRLGAGTKKTQYAAV